MDEIRKRIKNEYFKGINIELSDIALKKFVKDVWRRFLDGDDYYLVIPLSPLTRASDLEKLLKKPVLGYKIISKDGIQLLPPDEMGLIVNIDWEEADTLYLPDDLYKLKNFKADPEIRGVYSVNNGEGILNSSYESAKTIAEVLDIPFISINKHDYSPTYEMDYDLLVRDIICSYIIKTYGTLDVELRDKLVLKYRNDIYTAYNLLNKEEAFNDEAFINKMTNYINEQENIKVLKL